jgi:hypothetical protein
LPFLCEVSLSAGKRATQKFDVQKSNLKKLHDVEVKEQYQAKYHTGLQVWKTLMITETSTGLGKILERIS